MPILDVLNWISSHPATSMFGAYIMASIAARLAHELWPGAWWVDILSRFVGDLRPTVKDGKVTITVDEPKEPKP